MSIVVKLDQLGILGPSGASGPPGPSGSVGPQGPSGSVVGADHSTLANMAFPAGHTGFQQAMVWDDDLLVCIVPLNSY